MAQFTEPIRAVCKAKKIEYKGCFDCQRALAKSLHDAVQKKLNLSDEAWENMVKQTTGRPKDEYVAKAKAFAREVLS